MGKRQSTFTGLSRFVLEAFKQPDEQHTSTKNTSQPRSDTTKLTLKASSPETESTDDAGPSTKKRKVGLLGPGYEKYDATGLVPYFTEPSEVPERLRKCTCSSRIPDCPGTH